MELIKEFTLILENLNDNGWRSISSQKTLSIEFIRRYKNKLKWNSISAHFPLTREFVDEFEELLIFPSIFENQKLSEELIKYLLKNSLKSNTFHIWGYISSYQILSEEFIQKFEDKVDWYKISQYQILSEEFIQKFKDKVNWGQIAQYQILSKEFIQKFEEKIDFYTLSQNKYLTCEIIYLFKNKMNFENLFKSDISEMVKLRCSLFIKISGFNSNYDLKPKIKIVKKAYKGKHILTQDEVEAVFIMEKLLGNIL